MKKVKKFQALLLATFIALTPFFLNAQESDAHSMVYPTIGLGIGFFYPADVNDYIENEITSGYSSTVNTELYMYLELKAGLTFRLKNFDLTGALEYDIAPKFVVVTNGDNISYAFSRVAPEISGNFYFPNKSGKNAFFIGAGVNYSFITFKSFSASNPGAKFQLGYSMQFGNFNLQPYGAFRYVKAKDSDFTLDYTGGQIGVLLSFHKRMLYR